MEEDSSGQVIDAIAGMLVNGIPSGKIQEMLMDEGLSKNDSYNIISGIKGGLYKACMKSVYWGIFWIVLGVSVSLITFASAASSSEGGYYYIFWGPAVYGIYKVFRGLYQRSKISNA